MNKVVEGEEEKGSRIQRQGGKRLSISGLESCINGTSAVSFFFFNANDMKC